MGCSEFAVCEGAAFALVAFGGDEEAGVVFERQEEAAAGERIGRRVALHSISVAAVALALLPVAVGVSILIGSTLPLEFAAAACLTFLASIKIGARRGRRSQLSTT
jgi:hypothetical protein